MTAKCALALALLEGRIINIKNCFETIGLTNAPREIPRMIERPFGLVVSRQHMTGKSRYGQPITYTNYRLNRDAAYNQEGIKKLREYIKANIDNNPKTTQQAKELKQTKMFLDV